MFPFNKCSNEAAEAMPACLPKNPSTVDEGYADDFRGWYDVQVQYIRPSGRIYATAGQNQPETGQTPAKTGQHRPNIC